LPEKNLKIPGITFETFFPTPLMHFLNILGTKKYKRSILQTSLKQPGITLETSFKHHRNPCELI